MPTPRPPGVRCADVNEEQFVLAHNNQLPLGLYILGALGLRYALFALRFSQIGARLCSHQLRKFPTLGASLSRALEYFVFSRHPWRSQTFEIFIWRMI